MNDDSSSIIIESFTPNMQTVFDKAMEIITLEDIQDNKTGEKLKILRDYYMSEARENQFDSDYIDRSICIQNIMLVNRYITSSNSNYKKFKSFNEYYDRIEEEIKSLFPSKVKKTVILNQEKVFQKLAS